MKNDQKNHRDIADLLPWYLNKTLAPDQSGMVEAHLAICPACRQEIEGLKALETSVIASNQELPPPSADLMARTMARVGGYETERQTAKWQRFRRWPFYEIRFALPGLAMAQMAAIILLAATLAVFIGRANNYRATLAEEKQRADLNQKLLVEERQRFETLAQECISAPGDAVMINLSFREGASEKAIRDLLISIKANIIHGPSSAGIYVIAVPVSSGSDRSSALDGVLKQLRGRPEIVRFAEGSL